MMLKFKAVNFITCQSPVNIASKMVADCLLVDLLYIRYGQERVQDTIYLPETKKECAKELQQLLNITTQKTLVAVSDDSFKIFFEDPVQTRKSDWEEMFYLGIYRCCAAFFSSSDVN